MKSMVRDLVASDQAALPLVIDRSAKGNADQINAIGTGLGQAALICSRVDQMFANEVQQMVAASNNQSLVLAFTGVLGDQQLASVENGGGGGGGGGAGETANKAIFGAFVGSNGELNSDTSVKNTPTNIVALRFSAGGGDPASGNTANTPHTPTKPISVSPSQ
jgi:hypothetical protein